LPVADAVGEGATVGVAPGACDATLAGAVETGVEPVGPVVAPPPLHAAMVGREQNATVAAIRRTFNMVRSLTKATPADRFAASVAR